MKSGDWQMVFSLYLDMTFTGHLLQWHSLFTVSVPPCSYCFNVNDWITAIWELKQLIQVTLINNLFSFLPVWGPSLDFTGALSGIWWGVVVHTSCLSSGERALHWTVQCPSTSVMKTGCPVDYWDKSGSYSIIVIYFIYFPWWMLYNCQCLVHNCKKYLINLQNNFIHPTNKPKNASQHWIHAPNHHIKHALQFVHR